MNPFDRFDLDPREGIAGITRRLKELAEDANDAASRERIREAWEELTLHPARRLRAALFALPETRSPLGSPPPLWRRRAVPAVLDLAGLVPRPSVAVALGDAAPEIAIDAAPALDEDPLLEGA